jgi:hypothetical protein
MGKGGRNAERRDAEPNAPVHLKRETVEEHSMSGWPQSDDAIFTSFAPRTGTIAGVPETLAKGWV